MSAKRENPYTRLQREVSQFLADLWHRPKTALFNVTVNDWAKGQMDAAEALGYTLVITRKGNDITVHAVKKIKPHQVPYNVRPNHIEGCL